MNVNPDSPPGTSDDPEVSQRLPATGASATVDATPIDVPPVRRKRVAKAPVAPDVEAPGSTPEGAVSEAAAASVRKRRAPAIAQSTSEEIVVDATPAPVVIPAQAASDGQHQNGMAPPTGPELLVAFSQNDGLGDPARAQEQGEGQERGRRRNRNRRRGGREDQIEREGSDRPQLLQVDAVSAEVDLDDEDAAPVALDPEVVQAQLGEVFSELLSGAFDEEEAAVGDAVPLTDGVAPSAPPKRVLLAEPDAPKLQKVLAQSGVGSRRDMEQMILDGLITVNGQVAHVGQRISFGDQIKVDGRPIKVRIVPPPPRIIAYHKPVGEVVTHDDPQHRPTVFRRLPRLPHGKWQSVGRLDINTEGLLLFTNSGELANKLMHPRFGVEREYAVRVLGTLELDAKAKLLEGVEIEGQKAGFRSIENGGGEGVNHWYRVVITEGRNREVRKLFDAVGLTVSRLIRIRYGTVVLPRGLKRGVWVDLENNDVRLICQLAGHVQQARQGQHERGNPLKGKVGKRPPDRRDDRRPDRGPDRGPGARPEFNASRDGRGPSRGRPGEPRRDGPPSNQVRTEPRTPREEGWEDDFDPARIPNPLEQTFDKRFVQNPRSPAGGRGFRTGGGGFGAGGSAPDAPPPRKSGGPREPDPLQTSVGYIGGDAFHRKGGRGGGGRGGGGFGGSGGGHGGGGRRGR